MLRLVGRYVESIEVRFLHDIKRGKAEITPDGQQLLQGCSVGNGSMGNLTRQKRNDVTTSTIEGRECLKEWAASRH